MFRRRRSTKDFSDEVQAHLQLAAVSAKAKIATAEPTPSISTKIAARANPGFPASSGELQITNQIVEPEHTSFEVKTLLSSVDVAKDDSRPAVGFLTAQALGLEFIGVPIGTGLDTTSFRRWTQRIEVALRPWCSGCAARAPSRRKNQPPDNGESGRNRTSASQAAFYTSSQVIYEPEAIERCRLP